MLEEQLNTEYEENDVETLDTEQSSDSQEINQEPIEQQNIEPPQEETQDIDPELINHAKMRAEKAQKELAEFYERYQGENKLQDGVGNQFDNSVPPKITEDFMGYMKWIETQVKKANEFYEQHAKAQQQAIEAQAYNHSLDQYFHNSLQVAKSKYSDLDDAIGYVYNSRVQQLKGLSHIYPEYSDFNAIDAALRNELRHMVASCAKNGINPAEALYNMAGQYGYKKTNANVNSAVDNTKNYGNIRNAVNASRSLTSSGGGASSPDVTMESLANMSSYEFDKWYSNKDNKQKFLAMQGAI